MRYFPKVLGSLGKSLHLVMIGLAFSVAVSALATIDPFIGGTTGSYVTSDYSVTTNATAVALGDAITVNWTAPDAHSSTDYIRLSQVSSGNQQYSWQQTLGPGTSGTLTIPAPNQIDRFEFRLFSGVDNTLVGRSTSFVVDKAGLLVSVAPPQVAAGGEITVTWDAPADRPLNDSLILISSDSHATADQRYTSGADPKSTTFFAPQTPGNYEVRYQEFGSFVYSAISQIISVTAADGSFSGTVLNGDVNDYLSGAAVDVLQGGVVKGSAVTNVNGGYYIPISTAGTYDLRVQANGFATMVKPGLSVASGSSLEVDFTLKIKGTIAGTISRSTINTPLAGATVQVTQGGTSISSCTSDANGYYELGGLTPGTYSAEVGSSGYISQSQNNLTVTAGGMLTVNFLLQSEAGGSGNTLEYLYDDAGQLVGVKEQGILTKIYNYDSAGNLLSITSPPTTAPAIVSFTPSAGVLGTQVLISGINFGPTPQQNTVLFNGITASITSATSDEITALVPSGASTGPIVISAPGGSTTSSSPFIIGTGNSGLAPSVTSFSPSVGHPGDVVSITGANFQSDPSDNDVRFGATNSVVTSSNTSSISTVANTSSGKVSVTTPYGSSASQDVFLSVPNSVDLTKVDSKGRTWFGNTKHISIVGDRRAIYTFDGIAGKRISLKLLYLTAGLTLEIYRPDGKLLTTKVFSPNFASNTWFIDAVQTPLTGAYTIIASPTSANPGTVNFATLLYDVPPDVTGEISLNSSKTVIFTTPGQNGSLSFAAEAGQRVILRVSDNTTDGVVNLQRLLSAGSGSGPAIFGPRLAGGNVLFGATESYPVDGFSIPVTGTYMISLDPTGPSIGSMTVSFFLIPADAEYTMDIGSSQSVSTSAKGQNIWINFDGTAGQRVSLRTRNVTYANSVKLSLNKPDGSYFLLPVQAASNTFVDTLTLPVTGRYKIFIDPYGFDIGGADIDLCNVPPDVVGTTSINGPPVTVTVAAPGHNPTLQFSGSQGQTAWINATAATAPNGTPIYLRRPDGTVLTGGTITGGASVINSVTLPASGTYSIEVNPVGDSLGDVTLKLGGDVSQTITPGGSPSTVTVDNPGQSAWLSFNGTVGQRISIKLTNVSIASGYASIRKPDGSVLGDLITISLTAVNFIDTVTLPSNGQYSLLIDPVANNTGSATATVFNVPADAGGSIAEGSPQTKTTSIPGQNVSLTLSGTVNQKLTVELSSVSFPTGFLRVKKPDGTFLATTSFVMPSGSLTNVVLPVSGTFEVYIDPNQDYVGSFTAQIVGTGTGNANPTIQLSDSVSVLKGMPSNSQSTLTSSVSVLNGPFPSSSATGTFSDSVSVRYGNVQSGSLRSNVSVTTGPYVSSVSPTQITRGSSLQITVTGANLGSVNLVRFLRPDGYFDQTITVSNIVVNPAGTSLTATLQTNASTTLGQQIVVLYNSNSVNSPLLNFATNVVTIQ